MNLSVSAGFSGDMDFSASCGVLRCLHVFFFRILLGVDLVKTGILLSMNRDIAHITGFMDQSSDLTSLE